MFGVGPRFLCPWFNAFQYKWSHFSPPIGQRLFVLRLLFLVGGPNKKEGGHFREQTASAYFGLHPHGRLFLLPAAFFSKP